MKTFSGRRASQNEFELRSFIKLLCERDTRSYLEIGARHGDTFHEVMINLPVGSYGMAMDMPGALWGKASSIVSLHRAVDDLRNRGYIIDVVLGDSTAKSILAHIEHTASFDAILIDGDHRYAGVKADWENYRDFSNLIAFHDIVGTGQIEKVHKNQVEVPKLWAEIKAQDESVLEFIGEGSLMGIGVCISQ